MNTLSALAMKLDVRSMFASSRDRISDQALGRSAVNHKSISSQARESMNGKPPGLQLGDTVRHDRFGTGRVMARYPDGRMQIRFVGVGKSQMIFPSLLQW
jgi:hypothetical protein